MLNLLNAYQKIHAKINISPEIHKKELQNKWGGQTLFAATAQIHLLWRDMASLKCRNFYNQLDLRYCISHWIQM